jgi:hypothetical protein
MPTNLGTRPTIDAADAPNGISAYGDENVHIVAVVNNVLSRAETFTFSSALEQDADIAIRAVAHGWPATEQRHTLDPVWQILRQIDEGVFFRCGSVERLAILRVLRLKLLQVSISNTCCKNSTNHLYKASNKLRSGASPIDSPTVYAFQVCALYTAVLLH